MSGKRQKGRRIQQRTMHLGRFSTMEWISIRGRSAETSHFELFVSLGLRYRMPDRKARSASNSRDRVERGVVNWASIR